MSGTSTTALSVSTADDVALTPSSPASISTCDRQSRAPSSTAA
jgi:hypothetical protein